MRLSPAWRKISPPSNAPPSISCLHTYVSNLNSSPKMIGRCWCKRCCGSSRRRRFLSQSGSTGGSSARRTKKTAMPSTKRTSSSFPTSSTPSGRSCRPYPPVRKIAPSQSRYYKISTSNTHISSRLPSNKLPSTYSATSSISAASRRDG